MKPVTSKTQTLHGTAIYTYIDPQSTTPGLIGSPMAVPWSVWSITSVGEAPLLAWTARRTVALAAELEPQNSTNVAWAVGTVGTGETGTNERAEVKGAKTGDLKR